jgi:hypothetical protein
MRTASPILAALLLFAPGRPLADTNQQLCLCQFVAPVYAPFVRQVHIDGTIRLAITFNSNGKPLKGKRLEIRSTN